MAEGKFTKEQVAQLMRAISPARVATRSQPGSNRQMSYVEAWDIKATLIRIFGFGNFSAEVVESKILALDEVPQARNPEKMNWRAVAQATVRLTIHLTGAVYTETAVSAQAVPDIGEAADFAMKTAESDALKRAATYLGTQFGLSLYDNGTKQDVVRVVLDPEQAELLEQAKREDDPGADEARAKVDGSLKQ